MVEPQPEDATIQSETSYRELELVVYVGDLKVVGFAHFGVGQRASSRRPSDYIRAFSEDRLTLSRVRIYNKETNELIDTSPFSIINLGRADLMYARETGEPEGS